MYFDKVNYYSKVRNSLHVILLFLTLSMFLSGCSVGQKNTETSMLNDAETMQASLISGDIDTSQSYWSTTAHSFAKAPGGYYYVTCDGQTLMFWDEETNECYPVCGKANCDHDNGDCDAYLGLSIHEGDENDDQNDDQNGYYGYVGYTVYYYDGFIYLINTDGELVRVSPDGATKEKVASIYTYTDLIGENLVFYDNYVYAYNMNEHLGASEEYEETITKVSLKTGEKEIIVSYQGVGSAITKVRCYGDQLFFTITSLGKVDGNISYDYKGLYVYSLDTGACGKVIDDQVIDYVVDYNDNTIIYFVKDQGYYQYDIATNEKRQISEVREDNRVVSLSFDGTYIYEDNNLWVMLAKRSGITVERQIIVYDSDGNLVTSIDMSDVGIMEMFFGDQNYMFTEMKGSTLVYGYIDKSSISGLSTEWTVLGEE